MGDWRDLDRSQLNEETDAVVELEWEPYFEYPYRISSEKIVRTLDTGQIMDAPLLMPTPIGACTNVAKRADFFERTMGAQQFAAVR